MKEIKLTKDKVAIVSKEDYERVKGYKWHTVTADNTYYARNWKVGLMHRFLLNPDKDVIVDHKDHNGLNNTRGNIRLCDSSQNAANRRGGNGRSKYLGVSYTTLNGKPGWVASLKKGSLTLRSDLFKTEREAALAYDKMAIIHHKEFASLNILKKK